MNRISQNLFVWLLFLSSNLFSQGAKEIHSTSSKLATGKWFKMAITADGIYRLDYSGLRQKGLEDPSNPRVFCNNPGQLSYYNDGSASDDLKEIAIYTYTGSDGIFNEGDYLLFYAKSTHRWNYNELTKEYKFLRHNYSDTAFYFITSGSVPGKRIKIEAEPMGFPDYSSSETDVLYIHEVEKFNLIKSGRDWFQRITPFSGIKINPGFSNLITSEKIKYGIRVAARASRITQFNLYEGQSIKKSVIVQGVDMFNYTGTRAQITDSTGFILTGSASPEFEIRFSNNGQAYAEGYLDYVKLQGRAINSYTGQLRHFSDSRSVSPGRITNFTIRSTENAAIVWDVSDPYNSRQVNYTRNGENMTFKVKNDSLKIFIAFSPETVLNPIIRQVPVPNQDLHSSPPADMIIITHPFFIDYAKKLSDIHLKNSGLITQIVTTEQVYNEYSGGIADIAALRNFIRMKYLKQTGTGNPLKYLLLFGDGSYENKSLPPDNPNFIPTYQSQNSNVIVSSFTSDDFYGLLEDGEGEAEGTEDIGIGRFPVSDTVQAGIIISKIKKYLDPASMGDWRNVICLTADDEDGNAHMTDAEGLEVVIKQKAPEYNIEKIYLDAFRQTTNVNGQSYPDVNKAINDRINAGCLIFNYIGHGSEIGLTSEGVVKIEDINSWRNVGKLPLFITATCEFSRFDDLEINEATNKMTDKPSAGEKVLLNKEGGAIALMSTTRVVYSAPNFFLNRNIFNNAFSRDSTGNPLRLGDIIRIAKNNSGNGANKRNFSLLGDPALKLAYPWNGKVITDSVNNIALAGNVDSLKALSMVTIAGHIEGNNGSLLSNFNGIISPLIYDKENTIKTVANDGGPVMEFNLRNNKLFSGKTMAREGRFRFTFIVPRDINYSFGNGKISYYAHDDKVDMNGSCSEIIVGGFSNASINDSKGPVIKLYMNDTLFRAGCLTDENPVLVALLEDEGGINTTGSGIGHDLTGFLDNDRNKSFVLNNYYVSDFDNFSRGRITYNFSGLNEGSHSFTLKAWDNFNNSAEETLIFLVETDEKFILKNILNYPNPFIHETTITGEINRPDSELEVVISIFNINGKAIKVIKDKVPSTGYTLPPIIWDGKDDGGSRVARGMYPYVVTVTTGKGEIARSSGRMIIL